MSIRFECPECGSVLKIKDALAGTDGKCPKCKTTFVVPQVSAGSEAAEATMAGDDTSPGAVDLGTVATPLTSKPKKAKIEAPAKGGDDFDPVAFLMESGPQKPKGKSQPAAPSDRGGLSLDDGAPEEQPRQRPRSPEPAAPPVTAVSSVRGGGGLLSASNNAKDLLTRTMEESRARAAEMPSETKAPLIDTAQLKHLMFSRILPIGGGLIVLCAFFYWIVGGTSSNLILPEELVDARGVVIINGQPTAGVVVSMRYEPDPDNAEDRRWRASTAITDENGEFRMMFMEGYEGVVPGMQTVSLSYVVEGREMINDNYMEPGAVKLVVEEATYDLEIKTAIDTSPRPQAPPPAEDE